MTLYWLCDDQLCFCADDSFVDGYSLEDCKNSDRDPIYIGVCPSQSPENFSELIHRFLIGKIKSAPPEQKVVGSNPAGYAILTS